MDELISLGAAEVMEVQPSIKTRACPGNADDFYPRGVRVFRHAHLKELGHVG